MSGRIFCVAGYRILIIFFFSIANIFWEKYIFSLVSCHRRGFCSPTTVNNCTFAFSSKGKFLSFISVDLAAYLAGYPAFSITKYPACHTQFPTGYPVHSYQLASSQPCRQRQHVVKSISKGPSNFDIILSGAGLQQAAEPALVLPLTQRGLQAASNSFCYLCTCSTGTYVLQYDSRHSNSGDTRISCQVCSNKKFKPSKLSISYQIRSKRRR